jgi:hypothetical protein
MRAKKFSWLISQTARPTKSKRLLAVLTDFSGAVFDGDALLAVKETAVFDKPFVKKSVLIGTDDLPGSFYNELKSYSQRELLIFKTRAEALGWLIADSVNS